MRETWAKILYREPKNQPEKLTQGGGYWSEPNPFGEDGTNLGNFILCWPRELVEAMLKMAT